jgi:hypothetical protein
VERYGLANPISSDGYSPLLGAIIDTARREWRVRRGRIVESVDGPYGTSAILSNMHEPDLSSTFGYHNVSYAGAVNARFV